MLYCINSIVIVIIFFFKQKTAYDMRISDWSSDVGSSDLKGPSYKLTPAQIYQALAANPFGKEQKAEKWSDVDPSLPNSVISAFGPPSTSGTRDAFSELIMEKGCASDPAMKALKESDEDKYKEIGRA